MYKLFLFTFLIIVNAHGALRFGVGGGFEVKNNIRKNNLIQGYKDKTIYRFFPTGSLFAGRFYVIDKRALLTLYTSKLLSFRLFTDYTGEEYLGTGMSHRRRSLYGGASVSFILFHLSAASDLLGRSNGMRLMVATGLGVKIGELGRLSWRIGRQFYTKKYTNYYFGVKASEAAAERPAYIAHSTGNFIVTVTYQYHLFSHFRVAMALSYKTFGGEIADSPTVSASEQYSSLLWGIFTF